MLIVIPHFDGKTRHTRLPKCGRLGSESSLFLRFVLKKLRYSICKKISHCL